MNRSKLLTVLAMYFLIAGALNLVTFNLALNEDPLYLLQFATSTLLAFALAIGLFLQKKWSMYVFAFGAAALIVLNWFWLRAQPPAGLFWGTKWLFSVILNIFPGILMLFRRSYLRSGVAVAENGESNA